MKRLAFVVLLILSCDAEAGPGIRPATGGGGGATPSAASQNAVLYVPFNVPGCYASGSTALATNGAAMTITRSGTKYFPDTPNRGWWSSCPANQLAVEGNFGGALVEPPGTNILLTPTDSPTATGNWAPIAAGPTVTANALAYLDNTTTATSFTESAGVVSGLQQSFTAAAQNHCASIMFGWQTRDCWGVSLDGTTVHGKVNVKTGTVTYCPTYPDCSSSAATAKVSATSLGNGWVNATFCATLTAGAKTFQMFATAACSDNTKAATGGTALTGIARVMLEANSSAAAGRVTSYAPAGSPIGGDLVSFPVSFANGDICIGAKTSPTFSVWPARNEATVVAAYGVTQTLAAANSMYIQLAPTGASMTVYDASSGARSVIMTLASSGNATRVRDVKGCTSTTGALSLYVDGAVATNATGAGTGIITTPPTTLLVGVTAGSGIYAGQISGASFYDVIACNVSDPFLCGNSSLRATSSSNIALGDSITAGLVIGNTSSWTNAAATGSGTAIATIGRSGYSSTDCLTAYQAARGRHAKKVSVLCGTNDISSATFDTLRRTFEAIQADGATPIPMTILPRNLSGQTEKDRKMINSSILKWCSENGVTCADSATFMDAGTYGGTANQLRSTYDSGDGLHPNQTGMNALGGFMAPFFQ